MVKAFVSLALALTLISSRADAFGSPPSWSEEVAKGYFPYHRLIAADFPINDSVHPENAIYTRGYVRFRYNFHWTKQNGHVIARITDWSVWSGFDRNKSSRKSWFKKVEEALPHEQGHLGISELHSKRFAETPIDKLPVGEGSSGKDAATDLQRKMNALTERISAEAQAEQDRYDGRTSHGRDAAKQREWSADIQSRLRRVGIRF
jgi:hypothetical protein